MAEHENQVPQIEPEEADLNPALTMEAGMEATITELDSTSSPAHSWVLNSGASTHISRDKSNMSELRPTTAPLFVTTANGTKMPVLRTGCTPISSNNKLSNILYIPSMTRNLLSIGKLADQGNTVLFNSDHCYVVNNS